MTTRNARYPWQRLRDARTRAGYASAAKFAEAHGLTESTYRSHENGTRQMDIVTAQRYAPLLGVSWWWLLTGDAPPHEAPSARLYGTVGAGEQIVPSGEGPTETLEAPPGLRSPAAVTVRGESMLPAYRPGDLLFFDLDDGEPVPAEAMQRDCVVQVHDGPVYVKRLARGAAPGLYTLRSYAAGDIEDVLVDWARPIRWVRRL